MNKIIVPKDVCPLDVLAEMGERTKNSWIFLHSKAVEKLLHSDGVSVENQEKMVLKWEATEQYPQTIINVIRLTEELFIVVDISASDIAFTTMQKNPDEIIILEMAA